MTDVLFTEEDWEVVTQIRQQSQDRFFAGMRGKPLLGPTFGDGNLHIGNRVNADMWGDIYGPPEYAHAVYEPATGLVLACSYNVQWTLANARYNIELVGSFIGTLRREAVAIQAARASEEANAAIQKARVRTPRKIGKRARAVFDASEGKCHYCQTVLILDGRWHIEHKFPRALFGGSEQDNLAASCEPCNHAKRDKTDLEFQALLAAKAAD